MTPYTKEYIEGMESEYVKLRRERRIFQVINIIAAIAMGILVWGFLHQSHQIKHANGEIQDQRYTFVLRGCIDQNARHDTTITTLNRIIDQLPSKAARKRAETSKKFTVLLINALEPKQDCQALASRATSQPPTGG